MDRDQIGWGQKVASSMKRFKGEQGVANRIMILSGYSEHRATHYVGGVLVICLGNDCPAYAAGIKPTEKYGFNILVYDTDADMNPLQNPPTYSIIPWIATKAVNESLQDMYRMCGDFTNYDIRARCTSKDFGGTFEFLNLPQSLAQQVPGLAEQIAKDYQSKNRNVATEMGKVVTAAEMSELMAKPDTFSKSGAGNFSRPNRTVTPAQDGRLFGGGANQVSNLVGNAITSAIKQTQASAPTVAPLVIPAPAKFPAPIDPNSAPGVISIVETDAGIPAPTEAPKVVTQAQQNVSDLIAKLKKTQLK